MRINGHFSAAATSPWRAPLFRKNGGNVVLPSRITGADVGLLYVHRSFSIFIQSVCEKCDCGNTARRPGGGWGGYIYKDMKKKKGTERHGLEPCVCVLTRCSRDAIDPEADTCIIGSSREEEKNMYLRDVFFPPIRPLLRRLFRFLFGQVEAFCS